MKIAVLLMDIFFDLYTTSELEVWIPTFKQSCRTRSPCLGFLEMFPINKSSDHFFQFLAWGILLNLRYPCGRLRSQPMTRQSSRAGLF